MSKALDVALYLIELRDQDEKQGTYYTLTNLKLQKLLYYCQVAHYRWDKKRLISDSLFEAWAYGPTIWKVYQVFSTFGQIDVQAPMNKKKKRRPADHLARDEQETIEAVWTQLRSKSPFELAERSQHELPYVNARHERRLLLLDEDIEKTELDMWQNVQEESTIHP